MTLWCMHLTHRVDALTTAADLGYALTLGLGVVAVWLSDSSAWLRTRPGHRRYRRGAVVVIERDDGPS